jgi:hypothetical protein
MNEIKMALNFDDAPRPDTNMAMATLRAYADLCAAQARSIENYARAVNKLKYELDKLKGAK